MAMDALRAVVRRARLVAKINAGSLGCDQVGFVAKNLIDLS